MLRNPTDGLVTTVMWEASKTSGEHTANIRRVSNFARGDTFIPFESLTEDTVKGWITASLTEQETNVLNTVLDTQLTRMANPPVQPVNGLPW